MGNCYRLYARLSIGGQGVTNHGQIRRGMCIQLEANMNRGLEPNLASSSSDCLHPRPHLNQSPSRVDRGDGICVSIGSVLSYSLCRRDESATLCLLFGRPKIDQAQVWSWRTSPWRLCCAAVFGLICSFDALVQRLVAR